MPARLNKRQQREQEELLALAEPSQEKVVSSEDETIDASDHHSTGTGFAALFMPEEGEVDSTDEDSARPTKSRKPKRKKKKVASLQPSTKDGHLRAESTVYEPSLPRNASSPAQPKNEKKATKKAKAKERKADRNELDKALAELSVKYPDLRSISAPAATTFTSATRQPLSVLLSVSLPHLDSDAEMRKFFGAKVVSANKPSISGPSGSSSRRQPGTQRSQLTRPQPSWWGAKQREGLSVRLLTEDQVEAKMDRQLWDPVEEKWWTVEYSKKYKSMTMSFIQNVMSGDPDGFWNLLGKLPWHADTLLQLSEVYRHREEHSQAMDFVDRALFTYERSFIGTFNFTSGLNRLDFDHVENRPFFLAIHRKVVDLHRRGCVRTAFEFARLLYSIDPWNDPHGALFHLDYLAIKASMSQWLLDVFDHFETREKIEDAYGGRMDPSLLPGWAYARALALRIDENAKKDKSHEGSTAALKEAILSFPSVVIPMADKLDLGLPASILAHPAFRTQTGAGESSPTGTLHLISHLYVQRSFALWKDPELSSWLESTVVAISSSVKSPPASRRYHQLLHLYTVPNHRYSAYRHIMIQESSYRSLFSFIPKDILNARSLACDPLPPPTAMNQYDDEFFKGTENLFAPKRRTRQDVVADQRMLERLIPDPLVRGQLQAFFNAHPNFEERFPGGVVQFARMARELPEDVLEDMMFAEAMDEQDMENRGMPGEMPGQPMMFVEIMGDEDDDGQRNGDMPQIPILDQDAPEERRQDQEESEAETDEEDEDEDVLPLPVRLVRNLLNRFWTSGPNDESSSDSDERDERDAIPLDNGGRDVGP